MDKTTVERDVSEKTKMISSIASDSALENQGTTNEVVFVLEDPNSNGGTNSDMVLVLSDPTVADSEHTTNVEDRSEGAQGTKNDMVLSNPKAVAESEHTHDIEDSRIDRRSSIGEGRFCC